MRQRDPDEAYCQDEDIVYGSKEYRIGIDQFRDNMTYILDRAGKKECDCILSDLVSNIRDLPPFGASEGLGMEAHLAYQDALKRLAAGDLSGARSHFTMPRTSTLCAFGHAKR